MSLQIDATYSVEDNKLRLYASERLDADLYQRVKETGFKWAPKQELFVASRWTPAREDLCIELAGEITPEQTTMVERAEAKVARLDALADMRAKQSNAFFAAADRLSQRFAGGQPILIGHHSERSARRDQQKMHAAMDKAVQCSKAVEYWQWKAVGAECHANAKAKPGVRARRIKTLLKALRDHQRAINHAHICVALWTKVLAIAEPEEFKAAVEHFANVPLSTGDTCYFGAGSDLRDGKRQHQELAETALSQWQNRTNSVYRFRWINHLLNRLAYERSELGSVKRFAGNITAAIVQTFAREQGAHKPTAESKENGIWTLTSTVPLPAHVADGVCLGLNEDGWRDLMQSIGYEVPAPKAKQPPIFNFKAATITGHSWGNSYTFEQIEMTRVELAAIHKDYRGVKLSDCGQFRFKVCKNPEQTRWDAQWCAVYLTDSKTHPAPESNSISFEAPEAESNG